MLVIRLLRTGKKHQPFFRIVVCDKKNPPQGGRALEILGFFNPLTKEKSFKAERIKYWLSVGAQPSDTVHNFLIVEKIIEGDKANKFKLSKKKKEEIKNKEEAGKEEVKTEETKEDSKEEAPAKTTPEEKKEPESKPEDKKEEPTEEAPAEEKPKEKGEEVEK
ncbi:30S ribosomal protein S16 [Candidatus Parcubacteria bacterium]|nr:30S ribosomal protein S16 [Candidatus Parcubacteria bacterium]